MILLIVLEANKSARLFVLFLFWEFHLLWKLEVSVKIEMELKVYFKWVMVERLRTVNLKVKKLSYTIFSEIQATGKFTHLMFFCFLGNIEFVFDYCGTYWNIIICFRSWLLLQEPTEVIDGRFCECNNFNCPRHEGVPCGGK